MIKYKCDFWFNNFVSEFIHLLIMVLPYFVLSIGAGAILESKANFNIINDWVGKGKKEAFYSQVHLAHFYQGVPVQQCQWRRACYDVGPNLEQSQHL